MSLIPFSFHSIVSRSAPTSWPGTPDRRTWRDALMAGTTTAARFASALRDGFGRLPTPAKLGIVGVAAIGLAAPVASLLGFNENSATKAARSVSAWTGRDRQPRTPQASNSLASSAPAPMKTAPWPAPTMPGTGNDPNAGASPAPMASSSAPVEARHRFQPRWVHQTPSPGLTTQPRAVFVPPQRPIAPPIPLRPAQPIYEGPRNFTPRPMPFGSNFTPWQRQEFTPRSMPFGGFGGPFRFQGGGMPLRGYGGGFGGGRMPFFNGGGSFGGFHGRR